MHTVAATYKTPAPDGSGYLLVSTILCGGGLHMWTRALLVLALFTSSALGLASLAQFNYAGTNFTVPGACQPKLEH